MSTLAEFCDVEAAIGDVLRAVVGVPVYGALPAKAVPPFVRVQRISGMPVSSRPLYLDASLVQVDIYAPSKGQAHSIADLCRVVLANLANEETPHGWLAGCRLGSLSYSRDEAFTPAPDRYRLDLTAWGRVTTPVSSLPSRSREDTPT